MLFNFIPVPSDFGAQEKKMYHCFHFSPFTMKCWDQMPWSSFSECWVLSQLFHSSLSFLSRDSSSSLLSATRVVSSAYLRLLIFLPAILIPACASFPPTILHDGLFSAYKLNTQGNNIQPWCTPFPVLNQSVVPCPVLTIASCAAYRFLRRRVRWCGIPISWRIFFRLLWATQSKALA